jgi:D-alanyl-D-alanine carboxypeptidase
MKYPRVTTLRALLMVLALVLFGTPANAARSPLGPARYSAILVDAATGETLYQQAATQIRHPASITKVMTLYLAFDALRDGRLRLNDRIPISRHAASQQPSKLGLAAGNDISVADAISVIAVKSANDIAVAMAEKIGGSETGFARMMTRKARQIGMNQTVFTNASGLPDPGNFTSARDLAIMSMALLREHRQYYYYFGQRSVSYGSTTIKTHNHLLNRFAGYDGIKTGYTVDAGFSLAASAVRNGRRLIAIVLGEPSVAVRDQQVANLLDAGFRTLMRRERGEYVTVANLLPPSAFRPSRSGPYQRPVSVPASLAPTMDEGD